MKVAKQTVHLGYEVGTGAAVEIPLAHTFVTGQTQLSGKTTALRAIVERSGHRALAFVTKRGETFEGRRIRPYLPREGSKPIPWRLVETILASALGQRNMKYERLWIVNAAKGATSLAEVRENVSRLQLKAKGGAGDIYMLLGEYLDLVLPEMRQLAAGDTLDLQPGLNVMDLTGVGLQLQALVIRAALEQINLHETDILTVFPEAWEFAPRGRSAPAKDEAIAMARKGAVLRNFLLCDSQDLAGVDTVVRQAASVWLLGVQRELNELKRTLQMIPAGVKRPKAEDVAQLELGQFYVCYGRHAVKTFVQPAWMNPAQAEQVATGALSIDIASRLSPGSPAWGPRRTQKEDQVNAAEAQTLREENARLARENEDLRRRLGAHDDSQPVGRRRAGAPGEPRVDRAADHAVAGGGADAASSVGSLARNVSRQAPVGSAKEAPAPLDGIDTAYSRLLDRLVSDASRDPRLLRVLATRPELEVHVQRQVIEVSEDSTRGLVAKLIADGFFQRGQSSAATLKELQRRGRSLSPGTLYPELDKLAEMGFFRIEDGKDDRGRPRKEYHLVPGMTVNVITDEEVGGRRR